MKTLIKVSFAAALLLLGSPAFAALDSPSTVFTATGGTNNSTALAWAVISPRSANGGVPVIQFISAGSDSNNIAIFFYKVKGSVQVPVTGATVNIPVQATNGFAASDIVVLHHASSDTYERRVINTFTAATNIATTVAPFTAAQAGDTLYAVTRTGVPTLPWGAVTNTLTVNTVGGIYSGQRGMPLLVEIEGKVATAASIYVVSGYYAP